MRFNNVFGYYIEISKANLHLAPADYERKQTLVNAERFTTPELKELRAQDPRRRREDPGARTDDLRPTCAHFAAAHGQRDPRGTAAAVAELDVTAALAQVAAENRYARPRSPTPARCASSPAGIR